MDLVMDKIGYKELSDFYSKHFSLGWMGDEFDKKIALLSLICYLTEKAKSKKPDVTHYQVVRKLSPNHLPEDAIKGIAIVCEDLSWGCKEFPTFGVNPKEIPAKIKELLNLYLPF